MRVINLFSLINRYQMCVKPFTLPLRFHNIIVKNYGKCAITHNKFISTSIPRQSRIHQDESGSEEDDVDSEDAYTNVPMYDGYARDLLYKNSKDLLLRRIYSCASVQELFNVLETNINYYDCEHITQTVFVLYDLSKIYQEVFTSGSANSSKKFFDNLQGNNSFKKLLQLIENKINHFDLRTLSYCVLYLNKLGLSTETTTNDLLCNKLRKKLMNNFSLSSATRFLETVFSEVSLKSYFMSQQVIPLVFQKIDSCADAETLGSLSASLNTLHKIVTDETLNAYKEKVEDLIKNGLINSADYKVVLQIIAFLNYPKWREKNSVLISKCILLIKNNFNKLSVDEILLLYEIFFKLQEPGTILSDLQRCTSKYFHQLDDVPTAQKIMLLSTIIFFASPHLRNDFQKKLEKYVKECGDYENLILLRKLLSYIKISDIKLCNLYWNKILKFLKTDSKEIDLIKLSQNYVNFSNNNYRHNELENEILKLFESLVKEVNYEFFPQKLASVLNFVLLYGNNESLLEYLVTKIEQNWEQLKPIDCLKLSHALKMFNEMDKKYVKLPYARRINNVLDAFINKEITNMDTNLWKNNALLKSCVYKNKVDTALMSQLLQNYKHFHNISSKNIENIYYCFLMTNTLIPEVLDNIVDYVLTYKDHVLGFNVGRVIYLCYCLGYHPKNSLNFCETAVDIIIRDQERMTGLSVIYSALSLCFFNNLPNSLIKSVFNVEFMDKLDNELQNCYARDKYPHRVRSYLMQLNRAVCLDYPECNVPWFHQKYVDENIKAKNKKSTVFASRVKEHLARVVQNKNALSENVVTPYGYEIDFVVSLNFEDEIVDESQCTKRLALLLVPEYAYTRIISQLKGNFVLKRRHLEILGYKVVFIKFSDWISLFYAEDRIDFLKQLIWPKKFSKINIQASR